ncbi:50S ribosomal protein L25/general stress protein Ctc [Devriesea agamarum]|uniref:50S ribosomal protein L25/general stress protein Ctc n=1 Tax=Devriesea agamarum TaxID=472569 RepID=UPI00071CDC73|nr:50S ribosomal protein L25/general stress protein Ctc [Devriesea agamarum]
MAEKIKIEQRTEFGKGASRRIRAEHKVPAVIYGHGMEPVHIVMPGHETALAARNPNALLELELPSGESYLGLIKEVQRHPLKRTLTHLDLVVVRRGEKVHVDIPVTLTGEPVSPAIAVVEVQEITVEAEATHLPESIEVSVEGKEEGFQLFAGDLSLPKGTDLVTDAELLVVAVELPKAGKGEDSAEGEAEADSQE